MEAYSTSLRQMASIADSIYQSALQKGLNAAAAFLYPGYKSYKALSKRNVDEVELERWLMYWSVMGFISAFGQLHNTPASKGDPLIPPILEYVAEWLISWIPFYYFFKTLFLLFLALPQTQGSTFVYSMHLAPLLRGHEDQIDSALTQVKLAVYEFVQERLRLVWSTVVGGAPPSATATSATLTTNVAA
ncbi:15133_t:CDS:2, partial [Acaulospora colombiana]